MDEADWVDDLADALVQELEYNPRTAALFEKIDRFDLAEIREAFCVVICDKFYGLPPRETQGAIHAVK